MKPQITHAVFSLVALSVVASACATGGAVVSSSEERAVMAGMSSQEVAALLGRPASSIKYRASAGPTWTYDAGAIPGTRVFDVDFDASYHVVSAEERVPLIGN
jgi:hypothetical protein